MEYFRVTRHRLHHLRVEVRHYGNVIRDFGYNVCWSVYHGCLLYEVTEGCRRVKKPSTIDRIIGENVPQRVLNLICRFRTRVVTDGTNLYSPSSIRTPKRIG